jgi:hypothetical protein
LSAVDLDELATALGDQGYFEHRWLIDPDSGEIWPRRQTSHVVVKSLICPHGAASSSP